MNVLCVLSFVGVFGFTLAAVLTDFRSMRISNRLILAGLVTSLTLRIGQGGLAGIFPYLGNIFFPVIVLYLLFLIGAIGAGDIKLFSLIGGFVNFITLVNCMCMAFLVGTVFSAIRLVRSKSRLGWLRRGIFYLFSLLRGNRQPYARNPDKPENLIHFALCILLGLGISVFFRITDYI